MVTLGHIQHFVELHALWAYVLIILGVVLEGEIVVILAGIFAHLGSLNIVLAFVASVIGGGIKSAIGYSFGYYLKTHHSGRPLLHRAEHRVNYFLPRFSERPFWSMFLSRFLIMGIHWFALIFTGYKKIKILTFAKAESSSLLVWSAGMLSLGYFFSYTALSISRDVRKFLLIMILFFIAFFILEKVVAFIIELWETKEESNTK